jgi:hypothetical protein
MQGAKITRGSSHAGKPLINTKRDKQPKVKQKGPPKKEKKGNRINKQRIVFKLRKSTKGLQAKGKHEKAKEGSRNLKTKNYL